MQTSQQHQIPRLPSASVAAWVLFGASFLVLWLPTIIGLGRVWYSSDDFSHGFLIVPLAVYIVWQHREELARIPQRGHWGGLVVAVISLLGFLFGKVSGMATLASLAMIIFIWGSVLYLFGFAVFRNVSFPLVFLLFMVPVPSQLYAAITMPLQLMVSKASVTLAATAGIPVFREGNVIQLPDITFQVVQACSGLRSIMTMLTLGALIAYFMLRSPYFRIILFLLGIPVAIAVNIFRVLSMIVSYHFFSLDMTQGTPHTVLGIAVFTLALAIFMLIQKGLARCEA